MSDGYSSDIYLDFAQFSTQLMSSSTSSSHDSSLPPFFTSSTIPQWFQDPPPLLFSNAASSIPTTYMPGGFPAHLAPLNTPKSAISLACTLQQTFKTSPSSPPSPPHVSTPSPTSNNEANTPSPPPSIPPSAKRKRKEDLMKVNMGIQWDDYVPPDTQLVQLLENLTPVGAFGISIGHIDKNASVESESCIIYRQNQFKLQCTLTGSLKNYTTPHGDLGTSHALLGTVDGRLFEIDGLYLKMYAFKQSGNDATEEFKVPIHQVGPSRTKKETKPPEITPIINGAGFFDKLQFQASTHVGSESYFRIVVVLLAKFQEKYHVVTGKISPKLLVRAQNPGRYNAAAPPPSKPYNNNNPSTPATPGWQSSSSPSDHSSEDYEENRTHKPPNNSQATNVPKLWHNGEKDVVYLAIGWGIEI